MMPEVDLSAQNAKLRADVDRLMELTDLLMYEKFRTQEKARRFQKTLERIANWNPNLRDISFTVDEALNALSNQEECPSTYTHSNLGKLACEKDKAHLNRRGDVEHLNLGAGVKWMSI